MNEPYDYQTFHPVIRHFGHFIPVFGCFGHFLGILYLYQDFNQKKVVNSTIEGDWVVEETDQISPSEEHCELRLQVCWRPSPGGNGGAGCLKKYKLLFVVYLIDCGHPNMFKKNCGHFENIFWLATRTRILGSRFIFRAHDFFIKSRLKKVT